MVRQQHIPIQRVFGCRYEELKRQLQDAEMQAELENDELAFQRAAAAAALAIEQRKTQQVQVQISQQLQEVADDSTALEAAIAQAGSSSGDGGNENGTLADVALDNQPEGGEGPAARAVKKLEEELAAAADTSYTANMDEEEDITGKDH